MRLESKIVYAIGCFIQLRFWNEIWFDCSNRPYLLPMSSLPWSYAFCSPVVSCEMGTFRLCSWPAIVPTGWWWNCFWSLALQCPRWWCQCSNLRILSLARQASNIEINGWRDVDPFCPIWLYYMLTLLKCALSQVINRLTFIINLM